MPSIRDLCKIIDDISSSAIHPDDVDILTHHMTRCIQRINDVHPAIKQFLEEHLEYGEGTTCLKELHAQWLDWYDQHRAVDRERFYADVKTYFNDHFDPESLVINNVRTTGTSNTVFRQELWVAPPKS
jgi:hypothetical protein